MSLNDVYTILEYLQDLINKSQVLMLKIFNELIKPKNKQKRKNKILKLFGTSLRYYKNISGSITQLSNKQKQEKKRKKKCQEPIAKKAQIKSVVEIIRARLQIIPLETQEWLTVLPAHAYSRMLSSEEQIYI